MMRFLQGFFTGWLSLKANRLRSVLTMLGVVIGTGGVIGTMSFGDGAKFLILSEIEKMGGTSTFSVTRPDWVRRDKRWGPNPSREYLTYRDVALLEELCPSVEYATVDTGFRAHVRTPSGAKFSDLRATTDTYQAIRKWATDLGHFFSQTDVGLWNRVVAIGAEVARDLFGNIDPVGQEIRLNNQRYTVIGVMDAMGGGNSPAGSLDNQVFVPFTTSGATLQNDNRHVQNILLKAKAPELRERAQDEAKTVLLRYHNGDADFFQIHSQAAEMQTGATVISAALKIVLGVIAALALTIGGIGILNIMFVTVTERTHEIGLRKAVGAHRLDIAIQFLMEGLLLCLIGSSIGIFFGWLTERALAFAVVTFIFKGGSWPSMLSPFSIGLAITAGSLTGLVAGLAPSIRAANLPPIEALRH